MATDKISEDTPTARAKNRSERAPYRPGREKPVPVMLALQGGGAHTAFSWGVLDYLLERQEAGDIDIKAVSGTSGGAINAALVAYGLQASPAKARQLLREFWFKNSVAAALSFNPLCMPMPLFGSWNMDGFPLVILLNSLGLVFSPYQKLPGVNLLALAILSTINFKALNEDDGPKLYVLATNARTGHWKTFEKGKISIDAVLASACLPNVFPAVMLGGDPHWDGGYLKDPGLFPLVNYRDGGEDILIIGVNPFNRRIPYFPTTAWEIADRINEISFNSSLMAEIEKVLLVNDALAKHVDITAHRGEVRPEGAVAAEPKKPYQLHYLEPAEEMTALGVASKSNGSYAFAQFLFGLGKQMAAGWWPRCAANLGQRSTDLHKIVGYAHYERPTASDTGLFQVAHHFINNLMAPAARNWTYFVNEKGA